MSRRRHHKAERLGPKALEILESGLMQGVPYDVLADKIAVQTGEQISPAAIGRYYTAKFRPRIEATKSAQLVAKELSEWMSGSTDAEIREAIERRAARELLPLMSTLATEKPAEHAFFYAQMVGRRIDEAKLAQRERELELRTKKYETDRRLIETRLANLIKQQEEETKGGKRMTRAEVKRAVLEIYGLVRGEGE
jgi:hypothetical protein